MLNVTETARQKFMEHMTEEEKQDAYVRIHVSGVG